MRMIGTIADRMLGLVVPKTTAAGVCCDPGGGYESCGCGAADFIYQKYCHADCQCRLVCGPCTRTNISC